MPPEPGISLLSPHTYQVFQRSSRTRGDILISGRVRSAADAVRVRITGKPLEGSLAGDWQRLPFVTLSRSFSARLPLAAGGWYRVEIEAIQADRTVARVVVEKVGVGEVFVGAGQSNSTNYGEGATQPASGMVSTFSGTQWREATDPQPGCHDNSSGGSFWPSFGDAIVEKWQVPVGVAVTGHGGTSTNSWQPGGELFNWMMTRIHQLGPLGFRAVLWHQGESDVGMSADDYAARLSNIIEGSRDAAGWEIPWFVAQVSYHNAQNASYPTTRAGQKRLWDMRVALEGPDTDALGGDNRDTGGQGVHFSVKGLRAHGALWAAKVSAYLQGVLTD